MTEWQPIETCPEVGFENPGNYVLVRCQVDKKLHKKTWARELIFYAGYDAMTKRFWVPIPDNRNKEADFGNDEYKKNNKPIFEVLNYKPTHWMPLPAPPKGEIVLAILKAKAGVA